MSSVFTTTFRHRPILGHALFYFGVVFAVGFLLGVARVLWVLPHLGERYAELAEMPLMLIAMVLAARHSIKDSALTQALSWIQVGGLSLIFMVGAELLLAVWLAERSLSEYLGSRDPVSGCVYLLMLLVFAIMPWLCYRLQRPS